MKHRLARTRSSTRLLRRRRPLYLLLTVLALTLGMALGITTPVHADEPDIESINQQALTTLASKGVGVKQVSMTDTTSAALLEDGTLWTWGAGSSGAIGNGNTAYQYSPVQIMDSVEQVKLQRYVVSPAGGTYCAAIKSDGTLWMWGNNDCGEIGNGTVEDQATPVKILDSVKQVELGSLGCSAAIKEDGSLYTWGDNQYGILGNGSTKSQYTPMQVLDSVKCVAFGNRHIGVMRNDGSLWMCGGNWAGQLGTGDQQDRRSFVKILDSVKQFALGINVTAAIKPDGTLWTWGQSISGQTGNGTVDTRNLNPTQILDSVESVTFGRHFGTIYSDNGCTGAAIKSNGSLWMWGYNYNGVLGNGNTTDSPTPIQVLDSVKKVALGGDHTVALKNDGTVWTWGKGQLLGSGTSSTRYAPAQVFDSVKDIAVDDEGAYYSADKTTAAIREDGSLWMWGDNSYGQLGTGDSSSYKYNPIEVNFGFKSSGVHVTFDAGITKKEGVRPEMDIPWSLDSFKEDARKVSKATQKDLAVASLVLAANCYDTSLLESTMKEMGFGKFARFSYDSDPNRVDHTIASMVAQVDGKDTNIIGVVCRGSGDLLDWVSNLAQQAYGFAVAADNVHQNLSAYISNRSIDLTLPTKILITGHSRGAAVANILGTQLSHITPDQNVFVYTFACPNTTTDSSRYGYHNIKNYINPVLDVVTRNPVMVATHPKFGDYCEFPGDVVENSRVKDEFSNLTGGVNLPDIKALIGGDFSTSYPNLLAWNLRYHAPAVYMASLLGADTSSSGVAHGSPAIGCQEKIRAFSCTFR